MWAAGNSRSESRLDGRRDPKQSRSVGEQQSHQGRSYRHQSGIQSPPPPRSERKVWKREITNRCCYEVNVCVLSPGCMRRTGPAAETERPLACARRTFPPPAAPLWRCDCEGRARAESWRVSGGRRDPGVGDECVHYHLRLGGCCCRVSPPRPPRAPGLPTATRLSCLEYDSTAPRRATGTCPRAGICQILSQKIALAATRHIKRPRVAPPLPTGAVRAAPACAPAGSAQAPTPWG
jgi:hypothetical protein